ncbi:YkgJ family cysteine cluster protein [Natrarchaeobaculum aegyptiacum]|uniref:Zinc/iron-chelating domain-containing protein n=1 Tax=Natrarchaeobaculum aegyptiacum TaxID=745377 RepID=A0A2Z2HR25_9EURY|nr:zinc/iron-chelating domain-containing protein [Natrarchaeobaculum aegyptiacum]ARS89601.1 zinc/iron-chelating domain-containing protein [Natrarchaeobaculum aegyptiacum]
MEVNCEGCAGCCMDWRGLLSGTDPEDRERDGSTRGGYGPRATRGGRGPFVAAEAADDVDTPDREAGDAPRRQPLDDDPNFVPLTRDEVRAFLEAGLAAALTPRFFTVSDECEGLEIDGRSVAAVAGRPAFLVGLRKPSKPVAPFGRDEPVWLPTCVFLDPTTLQCRIHDSDLFPAECGAYPAHTLALEAEPECRRVEAVAGGDRLIDDEVPGPGDLEDLLLGTQAIGQKLFCHPDPDALEGVIERLAAGEATREDRATCLAVAAASSPGTFAISEYHREWGREQALDEPAETDGATWVEPAICEWHRRRERADGTPSPAVAVEIEEARGAPTTPGWDDLE